jgi:hypothetical protein
MLGFLFHTSVSTQIRSIFDALTGTDQDIDCSNTTAWDVTQLSCPATLESVSCSACISNNQANVIAGAIAIAGGIVMSIATIGHMFIEMGNERQKRLKSVRNMQPNAMAQMGI